jgi:hypothetical protein
VGTAVGTSVGTAVGTSVGTAVGGVVGTAVGGVVGTAVGGVVGTAAGTVVGAEVGAAVAPALAKGVAVPAGGNVGALVGTTAVREAVGGGEDAAEAAGGAGVGCGPGAGVTVETTPAGRVAVAVVIRMVAVGEGVSISGAGSGGARAAWPGDVGIVTSAAMVGGRMPVRSLPGPTNAYARAPAVRTAAAAVSNVPRIRRRSCIQGVFQVGFDDGVRSLTPPAALVSAAWSRARTGTARPDADINRLSSVMLGKGPEQTPGREATP